MKETKIAECVNPERTCRGCSYSFNPALYDGGCMLHFYHQGGAKSLEAAELETDAPRRAQKPQIQTANSTSQRGV